MKQLYLFIITLLFVVKADAQNLVPNPSFEDTIYCPTGFDELAATTFWYKPTQGSTDYFNSCSPVFGAGTDVNTPYNFMGYQQAHFGNGYAGFGLVYDSLDLNYREYLQVQLTSALVAGKKYIVNAYLAKADSAPLASKDIGIALSNNPIGGAYTTPISFTPQIIYSQFLTDTINWVEISDTIVASGGEQYLTIGYFKYNNTSDTMSLFYSEYNKYAYYYVDDVSVMEDTLTSIQTINSLNMDISIYPNPANKIFHINSRSNDFEILQLINGRGDVLKVFTPSNNYDVSEINQGFYYVKIIYKNQSSVYKKLLITKNN